MDREYVQGEVPRDFAKPVKQKPKDLTAKRVEVPDFCLERLKPHGRVHGQKDAEKLAETIRLAWRRVGYEVYPEIAYQVRGGRKNYYVRLPDLINGLPAEVVAKGAKT
jgi:hypothetical protein